MILFVKSLCHGSMHLRNVIFCPLSMHLCMGLILMGSTGPTADQLIKVLCLGNYPLDRILQGFKELLNPLKDLNMIQIANKIYLNHELHVEPSFRGMATSVFMSETETIDFDAANAVHRVNEWVENRTSRSRHSVQNILRPESLERSEMLVVNAVRFRGNWEKPFSRDQTKPGSFYVSETRKVVVNMMHGSVSCEVKCLVFTWKFVIL